MAYQPIDNVDPGADSLYSGSVKINANFVENYASIAAAEAATLVVQQKYYSRQRRVLIGDANFPRTPYYIAGHRSSNWNTPTSFSTYDTVANRIVAIPSWEEKGAVIQKTGVHVVASATGLAVLGLYSDSTSALYPLTKLKDFGTVNLANSVSDDIHSVENAYTVLSSGIYWYAVAFSVAQTDKISGLVQMFGELDVVNMPNAGANPPFTNGRFDIMGFLATYAYDGTLPTTFPAGATFLQYTAATTSIPIIYKAYSA